MGGHVCPVCGFPGLDESPRSASGGASYEICPSCGFEFGVSDEDLGFTYDEWRARWIAHGMAWDSADIEPPPDGWDPREQLKAIEE